MDTCIYFWNAALRRLPSQTSGTIFYSNWRFRMRLYKEVIAYWQSNLCCTNFRPGNEYTLPKTESLIVVCFVIVSSMFAERPLPPHSFHTVDVNISNRSHFELTQPTVSLTPYLDPFYQLFSPSPAPPSPEELAGTPDYSDIFRKYYLVLTTVYIC